MNLKAFSLCLAAILISWPALTKGDVAKIKAEPFAVPLGLPPIPWPINNQYTKKKADLGKLLYFDKRLSSNGTVSCASCHSIPDAFADRNPVSEGILDRKGSRHAPTIFNSAYLTHLFWDGRASSLEEQCKGPLANPDEMTLSNNPHAAHIECHKRVQNIPEYRSLFTEVFGSAECSIDDVAQAIATYERTILSGNSPYDRYKSGDTKAMTQEQIKGYQVFTNAGCSNCHFGFNFTDGRFLNIGIGMEDPSPDLGRYNITKDPKDWGAFKIPTLREVANTFPYMHDGSLKTLEEVIDYYDKGGIPNRNLHPLIKPLHLSLEDKKSLIAFLNALTGERGK